MQTKLEIARKIQDEIPAGSNPDLITDTKWSLESEVQARQQEIGYYTPYKEMLFVFEKGESKLYAGHPNSWAQCFLPGVYLGNYSALDGHYDTTDKYPKYSLIVDLSMTPFGFPEMKANRPVNPGENHLQLQYTDSGVNFQEIKDALLTNGVFEKINTARRANQTVLINCAAGQSRSVSVTILYLMETYRVGFVQAYRHLHKVRPEVCPNPGYVKSLLDSEPAIISPISIETARPWIDEYIKNNSLDSFSASFNDNQVILGKKNKNAYADGKFLAKEFIDIISFLKALSLSFTAVDCFKLTGNICMDAISYDKFKQILTENTPKAHKEDSLEFNRKTSFFAPKDVTHSPEEATNQVLFLSP